MIAPKIGRPRAISCSWVLTPGGRITAANRLLWARHQDSRRLARMRLRSRRSPEATATAGEALFSYGWAGFDASLKLTDLKDSAGRWRYGSWVLALGALTARGVIRGGLRIGPEAYRTEPTPVRLDQDTWLVPTVTNGVLGFRIEQSEIVLERRGYTFLTYSKLVVLYRALIADEKLNKSRRDFLSKKIARTIQTPKSAGPDPVLPLEKQ